MIFPRATAADSINRCRLIDPENHGTQLLPAASSAFTFLAAGGDSGNRGIAKP